MKIRVLGGGWYGCHLALALTRRGYEVELHEIADHLFAGASGGNPARLHLGFHYPRSRLTRAMCQETHEAFMGTYGFLTRTIPVNIYAVAAGHSQVDFGTYLQVLRGEVEFVQLERPAELGLKNVEGAVLTGERHIVIDQAREWFTHALGERVRFRAGATDPGAGFDWTIDCTFCANSASQVNRYEPCITAILQSAATDRAVTIMDGAFPSIYPWDEAKGLSSLTSALYTPFDKVETYGKAWRVLQEVTAAQIAARVLKMREQIRNFWPASWDLYHHVGEKLTIRAMPLSGADARLVDLETDRETRTLRIRAGKIDAIMHAERLVLEALR